MSLSMPNFMLLGPRLIPKLIVWDSFQNLRWKLCQITHQIPFVFLWRNGPMISVTEEPQLLKLGLNSKGFPHCPVMACMVTSQCILWEHYHWQYKGGVPFQRDLTPIVTSRSILSDVCLPLPMPLIMT